MHLDPEQIERLLHRELDPAEDARLQSHLRECSQCERRLERAAQQEEEIFAALRQLDHPAPPLPVGRVIERAAIRHPAWARIAAGMVLVLAASGVLYAVPGSPLPDLLHDARERLARTIAAESAPAADYASGVAILPGRRLEIVFSASQATGVLTVRMVDASEVAVRAVGEPVAFDLDVDRLTVANTGAEADYEVLLPRSAPEVTIRIGNTPVLQKEEERIGASTAPDETGVYRLPMTGIFRR